MYEKIIPLFVQLIIIVTSLIISNTNGFSMRMIPIESPHLQILPNHFTNHDLLHMLANISMARVLKFRTNLTPDSMQSKIYTQRTRFITQIGLGEGDGFIEPYLAIDTGSPLIWVQCEGCKNCFELSRGSNFDFRKSPTYRIINYDSPMCIPPSFNFRGICGFKMIYSIREPYPTVRGLVATDHFHLPNPETGIYDVYANVLFGCALDTTKFRSFGSPNIILGIFGMSSGTRSFVSQLDAYTKGRFSYCLPPTTYPSSVESTLYFGDDAQISGDATRQVQTISMNLVSYHLYVNGISVDGRRLDINPDVFELVGQSRKKGFFIDSGSPYTLLTRSAFDPVKTAVVNYFRDHYHWEAGDARGGLELCYGPYEDYKSKTYPLVVIHFRNNAHAGDIDMLLEKENMFLELDGQGFCMAIIPVPDPGPCLFGAYQQKNFNILFDIKNSLLSFVPQICRGNTS